MNKSLLFLTILLCSEALFSQKAIYIAPSGSDENVGSEDSPYKTIQKAFDESRKYKSQRVEIILRKGTYRPYSTLKLNENYSRTDIAPLVLKSFKGEEVIISGGKQITGWKKDVDGIYVANAPGMKFRQLYINGKKAIRSRYPDYNEKLNTLTLGCELSKPAMVVRQDLREVIDLSNSELAIRLRWGGARIPMSSKTYIEEDPANKKKAWGEIISVENEDAIAGLFTNKGNCKFWNQHPFGWFEGKKEFLNTENEWHLDKKTGKVYYIPPSGVDMTTAVIDVPVHTQILKMDKMKNLTIEGVIFETSDWQLPNDFYFAAQATYNQTIDDSHFRSPIYQDALKNIHKQGGWKDILPPSAIELENCENITFTKNVIRNAGGGGMSLRYREKNIKIIGNVFNLTGGNGITGNVSPNYRNKDLPTAKNVLIENNYFSNIGTEIFGTCGIGFYFANGLTIQNNEMYGLGYQAIHTGWNRHFNIGRLRNVYIKNNDIHNYMYVNNDGGAIHNVNFVLEDYIIEGNHIHDAAPMKYRKNGKALGIYMDNSTTNARVIGNVATDHIIGDLNGITSNRFKNYYEKHKGNLDIKLPYFEGNHTTFKHKNNRVNELPQEQIDKIISNSGVKKEFQFMKKYAAESVYWENAKYGNRYNDDPTLESSNKK